MPIFFKIALRNVFRNKRRTLITLLAINFGIIALMLFGGFMDAAFEGIRESFIHGSLGHLQIFKEGYWKNKGKEPLRFTISDYRGIESMIQDIRHVDFTMARTEFNGLVSNGRNSFIFIGKGVEPEKEKRLGLGSFVKIVQGEVLSSETPDGVMVGKGLARQLDMPIGEYLSIMTTTADGALNAIDAKLIGIFETGVKEYDDRILMLPLRLSQDLFWMDSVQSIITVLDKTENTNLVANELKQKFEQAGLSLEIKTWSELAYFYHQVVKIYYTIYNFLKMIIGVIVVLSIFNTMTMSVLERTREIGTIRALGTGRGRVLGLFTLEALIIGVIGGLLGLFFGSIACAGITHAGVNMPPPPGYTVGYPLYIKLVPRVMVSSFILAIITALLAGLFAAFRASRLEIVNALGHF
jgi:putative ABC transport system permease protein